MIDTIYSDPNFLAHHGVKGMKWGVRKDPERSGNVVNAFNGHAKGMEKLAAKASFTGSTSIKKPKVSSSAVTKIKKPQNAISAGSTEPKMTLSQRRVSADAKRDADEFAKAKMFYGEGAGTRRKLIKNTVESKKKKDSFYAQEFEKHLAAQDMGKRAVEAQKERKTKDMQANTVKVGKKITRAANSNVGRAVMSTLLNSL